jgi:hypothetical protein
VIFCEHFSIAFLNHVLFIGGIFVSDNGRIGESFP